MGLKNKFIRFMNGRYGLDNLSRLIIYTAIVVMLIASAFHIYPLSVISFLVFCYGYFRVFSKNIYKRSYENDQYLKVKRKVSTFLCKLGEKIGIVHCSCTSHGNEYTGNVKDEQYKIFKCPNCNQKLRVPRGKGKIKISCRRCGKEFIKKT